MTWLRCAWLWLLVFACVGCAGLPPVPSQGGRKWLRLETEHFVLYTDQREKLANTTITQFERWLSAYLQTGWQSEGKLALKLNVVVLDNLAQFEHLYGVNVRSWFAGPSFEPLVVMPRTNRSENWATLKHEVTEYITLQAIPIAPAWLYQGLGTYFETAFEKPSGALVLGGVPHSRIRRLRTQGHMPVRALFAVQNALDTPAMYESSWLLVHCLMSEHAEEFANFQRVLATGKSVEASWSEAFPKLPLDQLDAVLDRYSERGIYVNYALQVTAHATQVHVQALNDADVYGLRAELELSRAQEGQPISPEVDRNVQLALEAQPDNFRALALRARLANGARRLAMSRDLVRLHPEAWLAWLLLANAELDADLAASRCDPEVPERLVALAPEQPYAIGLAAACALRAGTDQEDNALHWSQRALSLRPSSTYLLKVRATVLQGLSRCDDLAELLPRLRNGWHKPIPASELDALSPCPSTVRVPLAGLSR